MSEKIPVYAFFHGGIMDLLPFDFIEIMKEEDTNIIEKIGFLGPLILFLKNIVNLWKQRIYLVGYVFFTFCNSLVNAVLKQYIKQERPKNGTSMRHITDGYGMPSAHAQSTMFSIIYLFLVNGSYFWLFIGLGIHVLTVYQRWKTKMHTMEQLCIGSLIGGFFSLFAYKMICKLSNGVKINQYI